MDKARRQERLILAAVFMFWFSMYTYPSFLSSYCQNVLNAAPALLGLITGSYGFTQMVLRIPLGIFSDVVKKRKPFIMAGLAASVLSGAGFAAVDMLNGGGSWAAWAALAARGLSGVAASAWVAFSVLYSSAYDGDEVAHAVGRMVVPQYGSQIIASLLGAQLAHRLGELSAFVLAALAALAGLIIFGFVDDRPPAGQPVKAMDFVSLLRERRLLLASMLALIMRLVCFATVLGFVQNWASDVAGLSTAQLGYLSIMYLVPNTIMARACGSRLVDRFGRRVMSTLGFLVLAAACGLYPVARNVWSLIAVQALFGAGMGMIIPITISCAIDEIDQDRRGAAMGFYQAVYGVGMFIGPVIAGMVIGAFPDILMGYVANFLAGMLISLLGAIIAWRYMPSKRAI